MFILGKHIPVPSPSSIQRVGVDLGQCHIDTSKFWSSHLLLWSVRWWRNQKRRPMGPPRDGRLQLPPTDRPLCTSDLPLPPSNSASVIPVAKLSSFHPRGQTSSPYWRHRSASLFLSVSVHPSVFPRGARLVFFSSIRCLSLFRRRDAVVRDASHLSFLLCNLESEPSNYYSYFEKTIKCDRTEYLRCSVPCPAPRTHLYPGRIFGRCGTSAQNTSSKIFQKDTETARDRYKRRGRGAERAVSSWS